MKRVLAGNALVLAGVAIGALTAFTTLRADPSPAQILFNRLREKVLDSMNRVPRYTCVETVTRAQYRPQYGGRPPLGCSALKAARAELNSNGFLMWHDRLRLDVAIGKDGEMFSWAGASAFETGEMDKLTSTGATGSGAFSSFLISIFGADGEQFRYTGERDIELGHLAAFEFAVPLARSHYSYRMNNGVDKIIPYRGEFYAVPATAELKRLVVDASEFPPGDACHVVDIMDYKTVKIGSGEFLLPEVSKMVVLYQGGEEARNETHFSNCHEFTGESTIRFDDPADPGSPASVARASLKSLPPKTRIRVKIDPPVRSETAAVGDPIVGAVEREIKEKGQVIVRTTDRLHGRLLRLEQFMMPEPYWLVAIRFDSIERDGVEQPIALRPLDDGDRSPAPPRYIGRRMQSIPAPASAVPDRPAGSGVFIFSSFGNLVLDQKFHSEWETK
jgi:hypothetical protein